MLGRTLGHYRVESKLGAGGMGVVYAASDTRLGRKVAIKLLHDEVAADVDRMARFEREARVLASLNHASIAAIHGLEESDGSKFLVLEYVPGETLVERIARGPLPVKEAFEICSQVAEGLAAAHEQGIVHRDLKPANIKITPEGKVKVLDFGLAKSTDSSPSSESPSDRPTMTAEMTQVGLVMGTAAYMSPEQACGKPVDRRTDIWAFGCVLFETLTGKMAFAGDSTTELLAAVIEREPDWAALPATVPDNIRRLLRRCLEKDRRSRLCDIGDARLELEETLTGRAAGAAASVPEARRRGRLVIAAIALLAVAGLAAAAGWWLQARRAGGAQAVVRFVHQLPAGHRMLQGWNPTVMFTPDGKSVAYSYEVDGVQTTFLRQIDELEQKPLGGTKNLVAPVFSPDGRFVAMVDTMDQGLKKIAIGGGAPVALTGTDMFGRGDWGLDGYIYFTDRYPGAIQRVREGGGAAEPVTKLDPKKSEFTHRHAQVLPGGKAVIFTAVSAGMESYNDARIELQVLGSGKRTLLVQGGFSPRYSPSGHIVYARAGDLYALPFEVGSFEPTGLPVKVVGGVQMSTNTGAASFDVSPGGSLAYVPGISEGGERKLVWVDRHGHAEPVTETLKSYVFPRISPDAKTIAVEIEGATHNLFSYDIAREVMTKLTTDGLSHAPVWTPDGRSLCYRSWKAGTMTMWEMPADQSEPGKRLTTVGSKQSAVSVSPDGKYLAFNQMGEMSDGSAMAGSMSEEAGSAPMGSGTDIWILPLQGADRQPRAFKKTNFDEASPKFSRDGKWVAYCSNRSDRTEVWVEPWPGPGMQLQLSSEGGIDPLFSRTADEVFYRTGDKMMVVKYRVVEGRFDPGKPETLWEGHYSYGMSSSCGPPGVSSANYDVTSDGQRFLMIKDDNEGVGSTRIVVVLNWAEELRRQAQAQKK